MAHTAPKLPPTCPATLLNCTGVAVALEATTLLEAGLVDTGLTGVAVALEGAALLPAGFLNTRLMLGKAVPVPWYCFLLEEPVGYGAEGVVARRGTTVMIEGITVTAAEVEAVVWEEEMTTEIAPEFEARLWGIVAVEVASLIVTYVVTFLAPYDVVVEEERLDALPTAGALDATGEEGERPGAEVDGFVAGADAKGTDATGVEEAGMDDAGV